MSDTPMIPSGILFPDPDSSYMDDWLVERYSGFLRESNEPSLWKLSETEQSHEYRFFFEESLYANGPVLVRLSIQPDDHAIATINVFKSVPKDPDAYYPEYHHILWIHKTISVSKKNIKRLFVQLEKIDFWQSPTNDPSTMIIKDGSTWYIEATKDKKYHFIERHSPTDKPIVDLGMLFMHLANLKGWKRHIKYSSVHNPKLDWMIDKIFWVLAKLLLPISDVIRRR